MMRMVCAPTAAISRKVSSGSMPTQLTRAKSFAAWAYSFMGFRSGALSFSAMLRCEKAGIMMGEEKSLPNREKERSASLLPISRSRIRMLSRYLLVMMAAFAGS